MSNLVGFTLTGGVSPENLQAVKTAQHRVLTHFDHLSQLSLEVGETRLELWGRGKLSDCINYLSDGTVLALIGSPVGSYPWETIEKKLSLASHPQDFELPWDGRVILLRISADGQRWTMWNDWLGSIPVFHASTGHGRIASTLEPVVVAAAGFSPDDIFLPALLSLFINGHFLGDWTLFKDMKVVPADCVAAWDDRGFTWKRLLTITPSQERWETGWDELVDEMYELSRQAIIDVLKTNPVWNLPLSAGLDSRLIAAVAAESGVEAYTYSWGSPDATDVIYARQIANTLGLPWKRIDIGTDFLVKYTRIWADCFGSTMHFHGMYQMAFLDAIKAEPAGPILSGFIGDVLAGDGVSLMATVHASGDSRQLENDDYTHWSAKEIETLFKIPVDDALDEIASEIKGEIEAMPGAWFQRLTFLELWSRQRHFTRFQSTLCDYWRGTATPFLNRAYARFCFSLPRVALDDRRLMGDVYRRHYGLLATIPGTYAPAPFILTGSYLLKRRIAMAVPAWLRRGPLRGFAPQELRMDVDCLHANGQKSLWPIFENQSRQPLAEWLDISQLEATYDAAMASREDIKPLRKLQSVQTLAYRLLDNQKGL